MTHVIRICGAKYAGACRVFNIIEGSMKELNKASRASISTLSLFEKREAQITKGVLEVYKGFLPSSKLKLVKFDENSTKKDAVSGSCKNGHTQFCFQKMNA